MERISTIVEGNLMTIPVLTDKHIAVMGKIRTGVIPGCAPDILRDLVEAGLLEEVHHGE